MKRTRNIAAFGMLIALAVVLSRFVSIKTPFVTLSFSFLPTALAGILWGPAAGALVGGMGDFIGATLFPTGPFYPGFTLTYALAGAVYGASLCRPKVRQLRLWLTCTAVNIAVYFALDSLWLYDIMGAGLFAMLGKRLMKNVVMIPVSALILAILLRRRDDLAAPFIAADKKHARREAAAFWQSFTGDTRAAVSAESAAEPAIAPIIQRFISEIRAENASV
ncbi:MAG: folate family ECF transporter S component [Oscillospiraceae bacterium]|nr:folate family ECF transporter S component [Oscillospiraceae bacterium]